MKRGTKALVIGIVVFVVLNLGFFVTPNFINNIIRFFADLFILFLGTGLHSKIFGSEYREVVTLSVIISIIIGIISYFIIPNKNEN